VAKHAALLAWFAPLALFSEDALAWGLCTHIYFTQLLIWAIPIADPRFRRAVARLPGLLLAGACLPDVSLFGRHIGAPTLDTTHQWSAAQRLLASARDDETRALALGYASHLLADIIAHNHFVPAHEQLWFNRPVMTHAAAEWAMDAYVTAQLFARPADLMRAHHARLGEYASDHFNCSGALARRAIAILDKGEALLRGSGLPRRLLQAARAMDPRVERRFNWYINETAARLGQINRLIDGDAPVWRAELDDPRPTRGRALRPPSGLAGAPLPQDFF